MIMHQDQSDLGQRMNKQLRLPLQHLLPVFLFSPIYQFTWLFAFPKLICNLGLNLFGDGDDLQRAWVVTMNPAEVSIHWLAFEKTGLFINSLIILFKLEEGVLYWGRSKVEFVPDETREKEEKKGKDKSKKSKEEEDAAEKQGTHLLDFKVRCLQL